MRNRSTFLLAVTVMLAASGSAFSADLPVKAPPPAVVTSTWTGFYAGLNAGGGWENTIDNSASLGACTVPGAGFCAAFSPVINAAVPGRFDTRPHGFIGGGQIGYNVQAGAFVWGLETDFQGANITGDASAATSGVAPAPAGTIAVAGTGSQKIDWFGTLRGRLGWLPVNSLLVYATGGLAYGHVQTGVSFSGSRLDDSGSVRHSGATAISQSDTRAGWAVGGGLEWMFAPRWSIKAEYLYYDLGTVTLNPTLTLTSTPAFPGNGSFSANIQSSAHYKGNIARAGVNYHF